MSGTTAWWEALPLAPAPPPAAAPAPDNIPTMRITPEPAGKWWEALPLAPEKPVAASPETKGGFLRNIGAGLIEGGAGLANVMTDPFGNLVGKPLATVGVFAHDALAPVFGYKRFPDNVRNELLGDTVPQPGTKAVNAIADVIGADRPENVPSETEGERIGRKVTTGALMGAAFGPTALGAAAGVGGAVVGDVAGQAAPEWASPMAEMVGNVAGGAATGVGAYGAQRGLIGLKNQASVAGVGPKTDIAEGLPGAPIVTRGQADLAAKMLRDNVGDQFPQLRETLTAGGPDEIMPGAPATTAQMTANRPEGVPLSRVAGLEQSARMRDAAPFIDIQRQQRDAMARGLSGMKPATFDPDGLANFFVSQLDQQTRDADASVATAGQGVRSATSAIGDVVEPALVGQAAREATTEALSPVRAAEGRLWQQLEQNPDLALNIDPTLETAAMLRREMATTAHVSGKPNADVATLLDQAAALPAVAPWRDMTTLRRQATDLTRRMSSGESLSTADMRRVTLIRESIDASIKKAVAEAAELNPEFAATLRAEAEQHNAAIRPPEGPTGSVYEGGNTRGGVGDVPPERGNAGAAERQSADVGSNRGLAARPAVGGDDIPTMVVRPERQAESLVDFLISKGGIRDQGGELRANDLQTVHHRAGGRLVNAKGLPLDYAREAAAEAGFIRPDATINDFLDAVTARQPVYRQSEQAAATITRDNARLGQLTDEARFVSGANVDDAAASAGVRLSPVELDHATELAMQGMHPDDAVRSAVAFSEDMVLQRNAERTAIGSPGVPAGARQAEMPVSNKPRLVPNLTAEDAATYSAARTATAEKHRVFGQGPVGQMMKRGEGSPYAVADAKVGRIFAHNSPTAVQDYGALVEAVGKPRADALTQQFLVNELKDQSRIFRPDGTLDAKSFDNWRAGPRGRVIEQIPGLREKFNTAATAQETLTAAEAARAEVIKRYRSTVKGKFIPPSNGDAPLAQSDVVGQVLAGPNTVPAFKRLVGEASKSADALESLKADVADYLTKRFTTMDEIGPSAQADFNKAETFRNWVNDRRDPLKRLYGGQGVQTIEQIAAAIRRARSVALAGEGSPTARYLQQSEKAGMTNTKLVGVPLIGAIGYLAGEALVSGMGLFSGPLSMLGTGLYAARQAGVANAKDLLAFSMAHPSVARELMVRIGPDGKIGPVAQRRIGAAIRAAIAAESQTRNAEDTSQ